MHLHRRDGRPNSNARRRGEDCCRPEDSVLGEGSARRNASANESCLGSVGGCDRPSSPASNHALGWFGENDHDLLISTDEEETLFTSRHPRQKTNIFLASRLAMTFVNEIDSAMNQVSLADQPRTPEFDGAVVLITGAASGSASSVCHRVF